MLVIIAVFDMATAWEVHATVISGGAERVNIRGPGPVWSGVVTRGSTQLQPGGPTIWKPFWVFVIFTRLEEGWLPPQECGQMGQCCSRLELVRTQEPDLVFGNFVDV